MVAKVISDVLVKVVGPDDEPLQGKFVYQPNSLRRDVLFNFTPAVRPLVFSTILKAEMVVGNKNFSVLAAEV